MGRGRSQALPGWVSQSVDRSIHNKMLLRDIIAYGARAAAGRRGGHFAWARVTPTRPGTVTSTQWMVISIMGQLGLNFQGRVDTVVSKSGTARGRACQVGMN